MNPLEPLRIPLGGLALIEASAGTGKTYTITTLYLRLLLQRGLEVDRILVVTFTQAATEELRERIRRRMAEALEWLQGDSAARRQDDPMLADLLLALPDREAAGTALTDALTRMDEASIYTIHGFCQRMLHDNAFESGTAFDVEFITDENRLRATAVADYWRARVAQSDPGRAQWVRERWKTPQALLKDLQPTLALDDLRVVPEVDEASVVQLRKELDQAFEKWQKMWRERGDEVRSILQSSPALNRRSYNKSVVAKAIRSAEELAIEIDPRSRLPGGIDRLSPAGLEKGTKPGQTPPTHPFFELCEHLVALSSQADASTLALFQISARTFVREALDRRKRDAGQLYFDDLLSRLDQALAGEGAGTLAAIIRRRFPVAMIDEFQDTDPQQYRIFRRVYAGRPDCSLFLIGDPKQAIYAFRGADIFTYMQAREDSEREGAQYTLGVNWRSGARLIMAVNTLFAGTPAPFIYEPHIQFNAVGPSPNADDDPLRLDGVEPVPLQFWMLEVNEDNQTKRPPGFIRRDKALEAAARACAEYIAGLLNRADAGRATLGERAILPKDIALLVRTHREGDLVQGALRACGVSSVTLSQDSVFDSEDAEELSTLLQALAELRDEGRMRAALTTGLLGRGASELHGLARDEIAWEAMLARFQAYRDLWLVRGCMVALQEMIAAEGIATRLLQRPDGQRRLTNLLQLVELLQVASREHPGIDGLLRWFADQRAGDQRDEARQLRLESDEGLVKVVTMHKSKGLEYPLVFIPFPWSYFEPQDRLPPFFHDADDKTACLDLGSTDQDRHRGLERVERLAERLRLFYVSVTRAAKFCVLCWGRINGVQDSALAYLLHRNPQSETPASRMQRLSEAEIRADVQALAAEQPACIAVHDLPTATGERWCGPAMDRACLAAAEFGSRIDTGWRVSSYSGLVRGDEAERPDYDAVALSESQREEPASSADRVFELPAGTHVGHMLHEVFETLDFPQATGEILETSVRGLLERYGPFQFGRGAAADAKLDWAPVVTEMVADVLNTHLDDARTLRLRDIGLSDRLTEMEFHFRVAGLNPEDLRGVLASSASYTTSADGLGFEPIRGLMRGFIDLVIRHQGRFYIVDYKSNLLGKRLADYRREGLEQAIHQHRYDLQYLIYTLALHRFLGRRLPSYDYERHFGGVYYLFLRGMRADQGPRYGVWHDRPGQVLVDRLERLFSGLEEAA